MIIPLIIMSVVRPLAAQRPQTRPQRFDLFQQFQRQRRAGEINAKIALQSQGRPGAVQAGAAEMPARRFAADRFQHADIHQLDNPLRMHGTGTAQIGQRQLGLLFQNAYRQLRQCVSGIHSLHPQFGARIEIHFLRHFSVKVLGGVAVGWRQRDRQYHIAIAGRIARYAASL